MGTVALAQLRECSRSMRRMNNFSLIQTGMAERKLTKPLGAKA